jgi:hypothetical protein
MANKPDPIRLLQMELILRWEGRLGNARLRDVFGLSQIRASQWIKEFRDAYPDWTQWNSVSRTFDATWRFYQNKLNNQDFSSSLTQYSSIIGLNSSIDNENTSVIVAAFPEITTPDPQIFSTLSHAAKLNRQVEIEYRSMKEPEPHSRIISPHSIVRAGRRWHVRAYSNLNQQFRDYTLGRISSVKILNDYAEKVMQDDIAWMTEVPVRLIAHPELSYEQETVIRYELFGNTSARVTSCRGALVSYFIQDVRAAVDVDKQKPPEYQLAIGNIKDIKQWLF